MRRLGLLFVLGLLPLLFWGCPTSPTQNYNYLRSPLTFQVDTLPAIHPYCSQGQTPFPSADSCQNTKKYALRWQRPVDTAGLLEFRIYLDTNPPNAAGKSWATISSDRTLASAIFPGVGGAADSLIFVFNNTPASTNLYSRGPQIIAFDSAGRSDNQGRLVFAIVAVYSSGTSGEPRYTWIIANDKFPPAPMLPTYTAFARTMQVDWSRPPDPTSFFDPGADSGIIQQYVLRVERSSLLNIFKADSFAPQVTYTNGGVDWTSRVVATSFTTVHGAPGRRFLLPDSQHVFNSHAPDPRDSLHVTVSGLTPQDTLDVTLWAVDVSGNATDSTLLTRIILTDTTEPLAPQLSLVSGSVTPNQFIFSFTDSRDLVQRGAVLVPADSPNGNILQYHLTRQLISGSTGGSANTDSIVTLDANSRDDTVFTDTVRDLPPGAHYRIYAQAMDSSGHLSQRDSLDVSTLANVFTGADTNYTCPPGFVPMPGSRFLLGDAKAADLPDADETPATMHYIKSYCIETYEHRDSTGAFQIHNTWQQAEAACAAVSPADSTHLCTEAEWERACKGSDTLAPLTYGFQSEDSTNPGAMLNACNVGTGDSAMAVTPSLRNPTCLTREGVFDMPGNLSEWVLDPYDSSAYSTVQSTDTLYPGQPLVAPNDTGLHGFRGGYYLNGHLAVTTTLHSAQCANRDYPTQIRPRVYPGCMDPSHPLLVVIYNNSALFPLCFPIPDSLQGRVASVSPGRDSNQILFLLNNVAQPVTYTLPANINYLGYRPVSAQLTPKSLAALTFVNSQTGDEIADTLDATQMLLDTSDATLSAIFSIEVAPPWSVLRGANGHYAINYLYGWAQIVNVKARRQYSNAVMGFRCCSLPRQP